jgi:hypothetical protein
MISALVRVTAELDFSSVFSAEGLFSDYTAIDISKSPIIKINFIIIAIQLFTFVNYLLRKVL